MKQDVKLLFTKMNSSSTAEEALTMITTIANSLCAILGLKVIPSLSVTHECGGACYLGITEADEDPLMIIATGTYKGYWQNYVYIGGLNSLSFPMKWENWQYSNSSAHGKWSPSSYLPLGAYMDCVSYDCYINYLKTDDGNIFFSFGKSSEIPSGYEFSIFKLNNTYVFSAVYNGGLNFSYNKIMNNVGYDKVVTQTISTSNSPFLKFQPERNNTIADMYYLNYKLPFNFYSNKEGYEGGHLLTIKNKDYINLYTYGSSSTGCILPINEEVNNGN